MQEAPEDRPAQMRQQKPRWSPPAFGLQCLLLRSGLLQQGFDQPHRLLLFWHNAFPSAIMSHVKDFLSFPFRLGFEWIVLHFSPFCNPFLRFSWSRWHKA